MQLSIDLHPVTGEWRIIDREGEVVCVSLRGERYLAKFAAAPEMFEALEFARTVLAGRPERSLADDLAVKRIDAAIAAALSRAGASS